MTARVRRAWAAVGLYYRQVEQDRSKIALSDLDTMLGETELRDTKQQFWRRYKMRFPPRSTPPIRRSRGWPGRCRSKCSASITSGGCSSSSPHLRRSASSVKGCSLKTARTKKWWPMMWTTTSTACSPSCWHMPWPAVPG